MHHSIPLWEHAAYSALVGMSPTAGSGYVRGSTLLASLGVDAFSVCLGRANGSDGYLTWGALRAPGHPAARLLVHDQWVARLGNITLAGAPSVRLCGSSPCSVLLDTGHSLIEGPQAQILELSKHIDGGLLQPTRAAHPEVRGGRPAAGAAAPGLRRPRRGHARGRAPRVALPAHGRHAEGVPAAQLPARVHDGAWGVLGELGPQWVIGMPFFRQYRTTFDRAEHAMSFEAMGPADCQRGGAAAPAGVSLAARGGRAEAAALAPVEVDLRDVVALAARRHAAPLALVAG
ncbi:unnamed protein product [Prorocentrum cordatum]|nr:unnamed protein product [Polarella glacialis]